MRRGQPHLHRAAAIAVGLAGAGVASEPSALAYGLAFVPLASVRSDLVIPKSAGGSREVQGLLKVRSSPWLIDQLASCPAMTRPIAASTSHSCGPRGPGARKVPLPAHGRGGLRLTVPPWDEHRCAPETR